MKEFQGENNVSDIFDNLEESLRNNVCKASEALYKIEDIQKILGKKNLNIDFPKGVIQTADYYRRLLSFIDDETLKSNIAYNLMLTDFYKWLLNTFGIDRTIKEMVIKELICTYGHILESIGKYLGEKYELKETYDSKELKRVKDFIKKSINDEILKNTILSYLGNLPNREIGVESALNKLAKEDIIEEGLKDKLIDDIWKVRCREHLTTLKNKEYGKYDSTLGKNAIKTFNKLLETLQNYEV